MNGNKKEVNKASDNWKTLIRIDDNIWSVTEEA